MKNHPSIILFVPMIVISCAIGWALITGSLRIRGIKEPISRQDSPREYWYYMRIFITLFVIGVALIVWTFL
jgi:hypothetical protein